MSSTATTPPRLDEELDFARALALDVGREALALQRAGSAALETREKPDGGGPVTRADLEANRRIVDAIAARFPHDGILAEESLNDPATRTRERVWMIDPIDGTREFAQGLDQWAVHIGLTIGGVPTMGVVARPALGLLLWGTVGQARAWLQRAGSEPVALAPPPAHATAPRVVASASRYSVRVAALSDELDIAAQDRLRMGSTGVKMSALCAGDAELYAHGSGGLSLWDTCAPMAILHAAGGRATDLRGGLLDHGPTASRHRLGLLATRGMDHEAVVRIIEDIGADWFDDGGLLPEHYPGISPDGSLDTSPDT